jgi:hypothetical protein
MDWGLVFTDIDIVDEASAVLIALMAIVGPFVIFKGGVALGAWAAKQINRVFG